MYDKIKLIIPRIRETPDITGFLSGGNVDSDINTGEIRAMYGSLEGLKVRIYPSCISIIGSWAKYLYSNNIYPLDRVSTKDVVEKLSDSLHWDISGAKVTGLEFGTQYVMTQPPDAYFALLGKMPRLIRSNVGSNLYYISNGKKQPQRLVFYDKKADAKNKKMELPKSFENANLLKYELRLDGRLPQQMKVPEVTASTLYDKEFYRLMIKRYQDSYFSISKRKRLRCDAMNTIKTVTDAFHVLFARLITQSNPELINEYLDDLKRAKVFGDRKNYSRLKKRIEEVKSKGGATVPDELIKELDDAIKNACAYD